MSILVRMAEQAANTIKYAFADYWQSPVALFQFSSGYDISFLIDEELGSLPLNDLPDIPLLPHPYESPHQLKLCRCAKQQVLILQGHHHLYDGYGINPCVLPIYAAALCGVRNFFLVDICSGIKSKLKPGHWVLITDYINNLGTSPLIGNPVLSNSHFLNMNEPFSHKLTTKLINAGKTVNFSPFLGVLQANLGPQFETPAEVKIAIKNGADVLSMGVVPETIMAHALGASVVSVCLVTNTAACNTRLPQKNEIIAECDFCSPQIISAFRQMLT